MMKDWISVRSEWPRAGQGWLDDIGWLRRAPRLLANAAVLGATQPTISVRVFRHGRYWTIIDHGGHWTTLDHGFNDREVAAAPRSDR